MLNNKKGGIIIPSFYTFSYETFASFPYGHEVYYESFFIPKNYININFVLNDNQTISNIQKVGINSNEYCGKIYGIKTTEQLVNYLNGEYFGIDSTDNTDFHNYKTFEQYNNQYHYGECDCNKRKLLEHNFIYHNGEYRCLDCGFSSFVGLYQFNASDYEFSEAYYNYIIDKNVTFGDDYSVKISGLSVIKNSNFLVLSSKNSTESYIEYTFEDNSIFKLDYNFSKFNDEDSTNSDAELKLEIFYQDAWIISETISIRDLSSDMTSYTKQFDKPINRFRFITKSSGITNQMGEFVFGNVTFYKALFGHEHSFAHSYGSYNKSYHKAFCKCGDYVLQGHSLGPSYIKGKIHIYAKCLLCKGEVYLGQNIDLFNLQNNSGINTLNETSNSPYFFAKRTFVTENGVIVLSRDDTKEYVESILHLNFEEYLRNLNNELI